MSPFRSISIHCRYRYLDHISKLKSFNHSSRRVLKIKKLRFLLRLANTR